MAASVGKLISELSNEFDILGVELTDENITDKLGDICESFSKDAVNIVEEWIAFTQKKQIASSDLSLENLVRFERELEKNASAKTTPKTPLTKKSRRPNHSVGDIVESENLLSLYDTSSPSPLVSNSSKRHLTPDNNSSKKRLNAHGSPMPVFIDEKSFSPVNANQSETYKNRSGKGDIIDALNTSNDISWKGVTSIKTSAVKVYNNLVENVNVDGGISYESQFKYMFQKNADKIDVLNEIIDNTAKELIKELGIGEFTSALLPTQESVTIVGRIACDSNGKLNSESVILEGSQEITGGRTVPLDLSGLKQYALFPGQIVSMDGVNMTGSKFIVKNIHHISIPPCTSLGEIQSPLRILVACGPFTTSDSLAYEPLGDLMKVVLDQTPDLCILMGPFVDEKNDTLATLSELSYHELFKNHLDNILEITKSVSTKFVFVPSSRDVHHSFVYPQPPYLLTSLSEDVKERVLFVQDPCVVEVNNVTIGITSTDSLLHLSQQELATGLADRVPRLIRHLLQQRRFYPLYPPGENVNLDFENWVDHAHLPTTPNILVLPSVLKQFAKFVSGSCCVNPGTVAKGKTGGSYAQLSINPCPGGESLEKNISVKVVKI